MGVAMIIRSRAFVVGFLAGLLIFLAANVRSYNQMQARMLSAEMHPELACYDCPEGFGVPFWVYETGGFASLPSPVLPLGIIADVLIAVLASLMTGYVCSSLFRVLRKRVDSFPQRTA